MEFAKRRKRRRRRNSGAGKLMAGLAMTCLVVYVITASAAGKWLAEKIMAPAFTALSDLSLFTPTALQDLEEDSAPVAQQDMLNVSLNDGIASVSSQVALPAISLHTLQMGAFSSRDNAMNLADSLQGRGAGGYICQDENIYRVLAAGYSSESDAKTVRDRMIGEGSDCTLYTISAPAVTFDITASKSQLSDIQGSFTALMTAQSAMEKACAEFDPGSMPVEEGLSMIKGISDTLSAAFSPLNNYRDASAAISAICQCCDQCVSSLSALEAAYYSSPAQLAADMQYALLELSDNYSAMLRDISQG